MAVPVSNHVKIQAASESVFTRAASLGRAGLDAVGATGQEAARPVGQIILGNDVLGGGNFGAMAQQIKHL